MLTAWWLPGLFGVALACGAVGGDNREGPAPLLCDPAASPASQPAIEPGSATRNSIDLVSGNKYLHQIDSAWPGGLIVERHYNSLNAFGQTLGPGWRHGFDTVIDLARTGSGWRAQVIQADGRRIVFESAPGGSGRQPLLLLPRQPGHGWVSVQPGLSADRRLAWHWRNGSQLHFDAGGRLTAIDHADGRRLALSHGGQPVRLREVQNRHGLALRFQYGGEQQRLVGVTLPDGRVVRYTYHSDGTLAAAHAPADPAPDTPPGKRPRWQFDYADNFLAALSVLRDGRGQVLGRWRYGPQGRAVYSSLAGQEEAIELRYRLPSSADTTGETLVTDRLGRETRYGWRYDARLQLRQWLYARGSGCRACPPTGIERRYDAGGRLRHQRSVSGRLTEWAYDRAGRLALRRDSVGAEHRTWHYRYAGDQPDAPLQQIATESVAANRRRQIDLVHDAQGRLVGADESGYEPVPASIVPRRPDHFAVRDFRPISRQRRIDLVTTGRAAGLPARERDPLDGRILREFIYDGHGYLTAIRQPAGLAQVFRRDPYGRIIERIGADGRRLTYRFDAIGQVIGSTDRGVPTRYEYDEHGRVSRIEPANRPAIDYRYSPAGRLTGLRDAQGNRIAFSWPDTTTAATAAPGSVSGTVHPLVAQWQAGVLTLERPDTADRTHWLLDDFGRAVANLDAHLGLRLWKYDARGRLAARVDGQGSRHVFHHDDADRLVAITDASGRALLARRFRAARLEAVAGPTQTEQFQQDADGRPVGRVLRLRDPAGLHRGPTVAVGEIFDERGRLQARELPDGHRLVYRWRADHTLEGLALQLAGGATIPLVTDCHWLPFTGGRRGLRRARLGNGTSVRLQYDPRLRVVGIVHQPAANQRATGLPGMERGFDAAGRTVRLSTTAGPERFAYDGRGFLESVAGGSPAGATDTWRYRADGSPATASLVLPATRQRARPVAGVGRPSRRWPTAPACCVPPAADPRACSPAVASSIATSTTCTESASPSYATTRPASRAGMSTNRAGWRWSSTPNTGCAACTCRSTTGHWRSSTLPIVRSASAGCTPTTGAFRWRSPTGRHAWSGPVATRRTDACWPPSTTARAGAPAPSRRSPAYRPPGRPAFRSRNWPARELPAQLRSGRRAIPERRPLGLRAGGYRHAYANNQPLDQTDPLGLYEIDVHYYLTYFAHSAGIGHDTSR
ncbi:MAG: DUF6531 domain-containing protein [Burkholderiaceae bacterium]